MPFGCAGVLAAQPVQVVAEGAAVRQARLAAAGDRRVLAEYLGDDLAEAPAVEDDMVAGPDQQGLVGGADWTMARRSSGGWVRSTPAALVVVQELLRAGVAAAGLVQAVTASRGR